MFSKSSDLNWEAEWLEGRGLDVTQVRGPFSAPHVESSPERVAIIDAGQSLEAVQASIRTELERQLAQPSAGESA